MVVNNILAQTLNFTPGDLEINRSGKLTSQQTKNLRNMILKQQAGWFTFILVLGACVGVAVAAYVKQVVVGIECGLFALVLLEVMAAFPHLSAASAINRGTVNMAQGVVSHRIYTNFTRNGIRTHYYVKVGDNQFDVDYSLYNAFQDGLIYRAYYVWIYGDIIVSAERI